MFLYTIPTTWLWHFIYAINACILHPCYYVLDCLEAVFGVLSEWETPASIALMLRACFCAAIFSALLLSFDQFFPATDRTSQYQLLLQSVCGTS